VGHRWEEQGELRVDATPEEVWDAIATGPGLDAWFMGRNEVRPGERIHTDMGDFTTDFTVTAWEPAKRLAYRADTADDGSFHAQEWLIEGRDGAATVVRTVTSGFIGRDDWQGEFDAARAGNAMYVHTLVQYLEHFRGRTARPSVAAGALPGGREALWGRLRDRLRLTGTPAVGDPLHLTPPRVGPLDAVADYVTPDFLGLRTADGLHRFFRAGDVVCVEHRLFGDGAATADAAWRLWFRETFPG